MWDGRLNRKIDKLVLLAVVLCAVVLAGEVLAYGPNPHSYGSDCSVRDGTVHVSVSSSGSDTYSVIFMDNGDFSPPAQLYILIDERYDENFDEVSETANLKKTDQRYAAEQVSISLRIRGFSDIVVCSGEQLLSAMTDDIGKGVPKGLLVMTYALPEGVYSGSEDDLLFDWIAEGNSMYWMDSPAGAFSRSGDEIMSVENGQTLFFGRECVNTGGADLALYAGDNPELTKALALKWNRTMNGINASGIEGAVSMGFLQDGFSTVSMVPFGKGMICVLGGAYDRNQCDDVSQIISSGISCYSDVLRIDSGTVTRGTSYITFEMPKGTEKVHVSVLMGGYYTVYGEAFDVR